MTTSTPDWTHRKETVNGVRLHWVEAGCGPVVVLLHGFPEFWYSWRHQIAALVHAGFRVVAPDLRGYNESDKPVGVHHYRMSILVDDVAGLIRRVGESQAAVVGHDWGGLIAWQVAMRRPEVVTKLAVLNAPHPAAMERELRRPMQWLRSLYILFFQLPWLPEWFLRSRNYAFLDRALLQEAVCPGAFTAEDVAQYKRALDRPGALTSALSYYRALFRFRRDATAYIHPIAAPTLLIWGVRDRYLGVRLSEGLERWVPDLRIERLPDASHWVQNDRPEQVSQLLAAFL